MIGDKVVAKVKLLKSDNGGQVDICFHANGGLGVETVERVELSSEDVESIMTRSVSISASKLAMLKNVMMVERRPYNKYGYQIIKHPQPYEFS